MQQRRPPWRHDVRDGALPDRDPADLPPSPHDQQPADHEDRPRPQHQAARLPPPPPEHPDGAHPHGTPVAGDRSDPAPVSQGHDRQWRCPAALPDHVRALAHPPCRRPGQAARCSQEGHRSLTTTRLHGCRSPLREWRFSLTWDRSSPVPTKRLPAIDFYLLIY